MVYAALAGDVALPWAVVGPSLTSFGIALTFPVMILAILDRAPGNARGAAASVQAFTQLIMGAVISSAVSPPSPARGSASPRRRCRSQSARRCCGPGTCSPAGAPCARRHVRDGPAPTPPRARPSRADGRLVMAKRSAPTPAAAALQAAGVDFAERSYHHDSAVTDFGQEAADALGVDPARVLKTLLVDDGSALAVAIVPVTGQVDLKAVAAALGVKKVAMADPRAAERSSGYVVGGISPFGQRRQLRTLVDTSALEHGTVLVSGGRRGLDLELAPADLVRVTDATTADIARA
ncbi:hypothetical protein GCM10025872_16100 [Barrientosiimonas endolithica]|uniref:YbaK/aminoacyl-tRNA synthetase-associated domain-containing protein n=2 Tax=Barrientosiimonas endolithica TaxID=1535208 RepID=A0ABM8HAJ6_9MICO|nr:hypothetical protein GCM10025872_16100 [Barrientosiimonas endolithica]